MKQGTDDCIFRMFWITIWIQEFFGGIILSHCLAVVSLIALMLEYEAFDVLTV